MFLAIILKEVTMKSKNNVFKKLFQIAAIFVLAILASLTVFSFNLRPTYSASVENPNFSNNMTDSTNTPASPSSYTFVDRNFKSVSYNPQSTSASQPNVKAGVINIEDQGYTKHSSEKDDYALMISSEYSTKYGYTSSQFTLEADSCYAISVDVYTVTTPGLASLYLVDENNTAYASFEHVGRADNWASYTFFVKTDDLTSYKLKLAMFLDGSGTTLFDSVKITELTDKQLESQYEAFKSTSCYVAPKTDNIISQTAFAKGDLASVFANSDSSIDYETGLNGNFGSAIVIKNNSSTHSQYTTKDDYFTFEQNRVYRLTLSAKAEDLSGKIKLSLIQTNLKQDEDGNDIYDTSSEKFSLTISSSTSNTVTDGYNKYSFFINTHPLKSTTYKLVVDFGDDDSTASGSLYLAGATLSKTTYSNFESVSTGETQQKINLATKIVDVDSDTKKLMLTNGNFNSVKPTDTTKVYPAAADSWTATLGENPQLYGVVNTAEFDKFTSSNTFARTAVNPGNPNGLTESNNLLMMYNSSTDSLAYTSEIDKSLDAGSYHRISLNVLTQHSTLNVYLVTKVNEKEVVLSSIKNVATDGNWHTVDLYVYTGVHQMSVGVKVEMNTTDAGFAYIDDATFDFALRSGSMLSQPSETEFNATTAGNFATNHIAKADLKNLLSGESSDRFATPTHFDYTENENVTFGTIDLTNDTDVRWILNKYDQYNENFTSLETKNILAIHAINYVSETYTANIGYRFDSSKYYLVSVKVYTQNLATSDDVDSFGLGVGLTTFDNSFKNINTETENGNSWKTYQFYIHPTDATTAMLKIVFGANGASLKGDAFLGDLTVEEIDSSKYIEKSTDTALVLAETTTTDDSKDDDDSKTDETTKSNNNAWIIAIPTILTAAAIILAVVGLSLRKIKFKKPVKKSKTDYDRNSKQSQQIYMRKATMMREQRLLELSKQLETLQNERTSYEEQYKKDLSSLRQLKIKRASANEIAKLEKDMKQNQRHSAQIGSSIRQVEMDIEFTKSSDYTKQVIKKLSSAKQDEE